jgi:hypothetical protein
MLGIVSTELHKFERADKFLKASLSINAENPSLYKKTRLMAGFFSPADAVAYMLHPEAGHST